MKHHLVPFGFAIAGLLVHSSAQTELLRFEGTTQNGVPWTVLDAGDMDGDGVDDLLVNDFGERTVRVISGGIGTELCSVPWNDPVSSWGVSSIGDLDADGVNEIGLGSWSAYSNRGAFRIHSGRDGTQLLEVRGSGPGARYGGLSGLGDIDADGTVDFAVSSLGAYPGNAFYSPTQLEVRSGITGAVIRQVGPEAGAFTLSSGPFGDLDGDGHDDLLIVQARLSSGSFTYVIKVLSGANLDLLLTVHETGPGEFGGIRASRAGDIDADGVPDILVRSPQYMARRGLVSVVSGATGAPIRRIVGPANGQYFGSASASGEDLDGDGIPDVVVGSFGDGTSNRGATFVHSLADTSTPLIGQTLGVNLNDYHGRIVTIVGDLDGDGAHEYTSVTPGFNGLANDSGLAQVFTLGDPVTVVNFDSAAGASPLVNGQPLGRADGLPGGVRVLGAGMGAAGAAVFDSSPNGPNAMGGDPDLLVGRGNVLILQGDPAQSGGLYTAPGTAAAGGILALGFPTPSTLRSIDLVDMGRNAPLQGAFVRMLDTSGRSRRYVVPAGFTGDAAAGNGFGTRRLFLSSLTDQVGLTATATAQEDLGFDPSRVVLLQVRLVGPGAVDELRFVP